MAKQPAKRRGKRGGLSAAHRLFAHEAATPGVSAAAAYRAVYPKASQRTSEVEASKLLRQPAVAELVARLRERDLAKADSKRDEVLAELHHVGLARLSRVIRDDGTVKPLSEWTEHELAALSSLEVDIERERGEPRFTDDGAELPPREVGRVSHLGMKGKLDALAILAKHHKLVDKDDAGQVITNVIIELKDPFALAKVVK